MSASGTKKKGAKYRYAVIPAAAITDPAISAQDLRLLCLLGRHTDENGWCRRSQVKMAVELSVSRSTVQRSLDHLVEAGYVQKREEGRPGIEPEPGVHPFASYSYRVRLDLDDEVEAEGGARQRAGDVPADGHGVPIKDGHGVPISRAPLIEHSPLEQSPQEPTPSLPLGDVGGQPLREDGFERAWQTFRACPGFSANMSKDDARKAWNSMRKGRPPDDELIAAIAAYGHWLAAENASRAKHGNGPHPMAHPATWLRGQRWKGFLEAAQQSRAERDRLAAALKPLGDGLLNRLRGAGFDDAEIAVWFEDAEFTVADAALTVTVPKTFARNYVDTYYATKLRRAFGVESVMVQLRAAAA